MARVLNFSAGPAVLPEVVLGKAAGEMLDWHGSGMSVMEMSHRGKEFISIHAEAEADLESSKARSVVIVDDVKRRFYYVGWRLDI